MDIQRLTYFSPTSIRLPEEIYDIIKNDAYYFEFRKNNKSNINGFLNELIPAISAFRDLFYQAVYDDCEGNKPLTDKVVQVFNSFNATQTLYQDNNVTVSLRVNKSHYQDFIYIHDKQLSAFNLDFSEFVRDGLIDYASRRTSLRERIFACKFLPVLFDSISKRQMCRFYLKDQIISFAPIQIVISPYNDGNLILGVNTEQKSTIVMPLAAVKQIVPQKQTITVGNKELKSLQTVLQSYLDKQKNTSHV